MVASTEGNNHGVGGVSGEFTSGGPLSSGGPEGDDEGLSLVTYWLNK